jgi:hypothetical protein
MCPRIDGGVIAIYVIGISGAAGGKRKEDSFACIHLFWDLHWFSSLRSPAEGSQFL